MGKAKISTETYNLIELMLEYNIQAEAKLKRALTKRVNKRLGKNKYIFTDKSGRTFIL